jgi:hypothetical protein
LAAGGFGSCDGGDAGSLGQFNSAEVTTACAELYDPATGQWTATGSLKPGAAFQTATFLPGSRILVTGGLNLQGIESVETSSTAPYIP